MTLNIGDGRDTLSGGKKGTSAIMKIVLKDLNEQTSLRIREAYRGNEKHMLERLAKNGNLCEEVFLDSLSPTTQFFVNKFAERANEVSSQ